MWKEPWRGDRRKSVLRLVTPTTRARLYEKLKTEERFLSGHRRRTKKKKMCSPPGYTAIDSKVHGQPLRLDSIQTCLPEREGGVSVSSTQEDYQRVAFYPGQEEIVGEAFV